MNDWAKFLTKFYKDKKKTQKNYMFKDAMKDAKKVYKKKGTGVTAKSGKRARKIRGGAVGDDEETDEPAAEPAAVEPATGAEPAAVEPANTTADANAAANTTMGGAKGRSRKMRRGKSQRKMRRGRSNRRTRK